MFKSILSKYLIAFIAIIVACFMIFTAIILVIFNSYGYGIMEQAAQKNGQSVRRYLYQSYTFQGPQNFDGVVAVKKNDVLGYINLLPNLYNDMHIFVANYKGRILVVDKESNRFFLDDDLPYSVIEKIKSYPKSDDYFFNMSNELTSVSGKDTHTYLIPVYAKNNGFAGVIGISVTGTATTELSRNIIASILVATLIILVITIILIYFLTKRITDPLRSMSDAAKEYGKGNFSPRLPVRGNDEISSLSLALNNMASELEGGENVRNEFLSSVSHELRSPLTSINGFVEGMMDGHIPPENHQKYLGIVSVEVKRLSRLIGSLMDLSRIQSGDKKFNFVDFNICETARRILISLEQKIDNRKLDVEFITDEDDMYVRADEDAIYQTLYNICQNAVKFSYDGGLFRIRINRKEDKTYVSVFNEGIGIAEKELPYVFRRFYKSDKSRGVDKTGVGLGMYLAKTIIEAHDEEIWVKSEFEKNCEFVFTLKSVQVDPKRRGNRDNS